MAEEKKNMREGGNKEERHLSISSLIKGIMDGTLLTRKSVLRQLPFILFLAFIGILYISNRYHADRTRRITQQLKTELGELRAHSLYTSSELMKIGRQTEVAEMVKKYGLSLKESQVPPKKIVVKDIPGE